QPDNVIRYEVSMYKLAQSPAYAHLHKITIDPVTGDKTIDYQQAKNAVCKAIEKAEKLGYLKVDRNDRVMLELSYNAYNAFLKSGEYKDRYYFKNGTVYKRGCNVYTFNRNFRKVVTKAKRKVSVNPYDST